jgi:uncharacterized protein YjbI with pentapeptide repeats
MEEHQMERQEQPRWRPTRRQVLWTLGIVAVLAGAVLIGYRYDITFWDWIKILIAPLAIAIVAAWINWAQRQREREAEAAQEREREAAEEAVRLRELEVEDQRAQDEALQAYLDNISELLPIKDSPSAAAKTRAQTLTVLRRLDGERKSRVLQFLYESEMLIEHEAGLWNERRLGPELLEEADLSHAALSGVRLVGAYLYGAILSEADLSEADLSGASLFSVDLSHANLSGAYLIGAVLVTADLSKANLYGANLRRAQGRRISLREANLRGADLRESDIIGSETNLRGANLSGANLSEANLSGASYFGVDLSHANLSGAYLMGADLRGAKGWTEEQLATCRTLKATTMPNGQKYEDWIKDKEGHKQDENHNGPP